MRLDPVLARVLRAIALNRTPGFNFPGYFLELSYDRVEESAVVATLDTGPHSADASGQMSIGPLALLADMALATSLRAHVGAGARIATVSMHLQLTGARREGRLRAKSQFDGFVEGVQGKQGMSRVEIRGGKKPVCLGTATFMVIGGPNATPPHPLPKRGSSRARDVPHPDHLNAEEERVFLRAAEALRGNGAFIENFWGYMPKQTKDGATCSAPHGLHIGNRVGHAQGGVTFGLAAHTAAAALGREWSLVGASAWYIGPGTGIKLRAKSEIVHRGSLTAVVRTRIENDEKRGVLECVTSHSRTASPPRG